jgi:hypothetical protein
MTANSHDKDTLVGPKPNPRLFRSRIDLLSVHDSAPTRAGAPALVDARGSIPEGFIISTLYRWLAGDLSISPALPRCGYQAAAAFALIGGTARKAIESLFHALMVAISMVRLTASASEKCARTSL